MKGYEKLIIMGIGNELKSDDGVGPFIIKKLSALDLSNVLLINAQTVPENFTGKIRKENPTHIIIVDACLMGLNPGDIKIVSEDDFSDIGISTHSMSLSYFIRFLNHKNIIFIGIEPESLNLIGDNPLSSDGDISLTDNVYTAALDFIDLLEEIL